MNAAVKPINGLKRHRLALGLTQGEFAKRLGVTVQAVSLWENGDAVPGPKMYPRIAELLGITALEVTRLISPE